MPNSLSISSDAFERILTELPEKEEFVMLGKILPPLLMGSLTRYLYDGVETGGFCRAVITNDLNMAVRLADSSNKLWLCEIVQLVNNVFPAPAKDIALWTELHRRRNQNRDNEASR